MRRLLSASSQKPGKVGFESCRLVHGMCDFWKAWHRGLFLEGTCPELPSYCYGFQRTRRRDGAVAPHLALAARCRHESISFVDESLDMANAFGSLDRKHLRGPCARMTRTFRETMSLVWKDMFGPCARMTRTIREMKSLVWKDMFAWPLRKDDTHHSRNEVIGLEGYVCVAPAQG